MKFRLVRYFTLASLLAFVVVTVGLAMFYRESAVKDLLLLQESKNVALTKVFANSLWGRFRSLVQDSSGKTGEEILADPRIAELSETTLGLLRGLSVVKVKVFNLEGLTVFSTEAAQIGADKSDNAGYLSALRGIPASELTHRDTFSAFEGQKEDLDVISSYIPIINPATGEMEGVFEVYDEVTPFLAQIKQTQVIVVVGVVAALAVLFLVLFLIVRRADGIIVRNNRERAEAETQLAQSEKMASLGQMVAGVAHELNTPLGFTNSNLALIDEMMADFEGLTNAAGSTARYLKDKDDIEAARHAKSLSEGPGAEDVAQIREMLGFCMEGVGQMTELVTNLKDFARLDRAKVAAIDINEAADNVLRIARNVLKDGIKVNRLYGSVQPVECMPSQINQVLLNLITNAAQAMGGQGKLWIKTEQVGDKLQILVQDTGSGIPQDQLGQIFEPFYTTRSDGTGLGLYIIDQHSGSISVISQVGKGTRFVIELPLKQHNMQDLAAAA